MKTVADVLGEDWQGSEVITDAIQKCLSVVNDPKYKKILCSVSLGSDSDCMLDLVTRCSERNNVDYVFINTGFELDCTLHHKHFLESRYGIEIKEYKTKTPVPLAIKQKGIPFLSKTTSEFLGRLQNHEFDFTNDGWKSYDELILKYPKCKSALAWWTNSNQSIAFCINYHSWLKEFIISNPPSFKISNRCCDIVKKRSAHSLLEEGNYDCDLVGLRRSEGGARQLRYKNCFDSKENAADVYRPLWWMDDSVKAEYEQKFKIIHSDAYGVYGFKRTGCTSCSFGRDFEFELEAVKKYEPKKYPACLNIYGPAYEYTRAYHKYRDRMKQAKAEGGIDHE